MSGTCLLVGAIALHLGQGSFELGWQHSVEKTGWREIWRVENGTLRLMEAAVKGSGAGMEPGDDAQLLDGWWVWHPDLPPVASLTLAASGATQGGWQICHDGTCREIGKIQSDPITVKACKE